MKRMGGGFTYWWRVSDLTRTLVRGAGIAAAALFGAVVLLWMAVATARGLAMGLSLLYETPFWWAAPVAVVVLYLRFGK